MGKTSALRRLEHGQLPGGLAREVVLNLQDVAFLRDHFVENRADHPPEE